jgi:hypothetical protein
MRLQPALPVTFVFWDCIEMWTEFAPTGFCTICSPRRVRRQCVSSKVAEVTVLMVGGGVMSEQLVVRKSAAAMQGRRERFMRAAYTPRRGPQ